METGLEARSLVLNTDAPEATLWVYSQVLVIPKIPSLLPNRGRKSQSLVPGVVNTPVNPSSTTTYFQSVFWEIFSLTRYTSTWTLQLQSWVCEWSYGTLFIRPPLVWTAHSMQWPVYPCCGSCWVSLVRARVVREKHMGETEAGLPRS